LAPGSRLLTPPRKNVDSCGPIRPCPRPAGPGAPFLTTHIHSARRPPHSLEIAELNIHYTNVVFIMFLVYRDCFRFFP
jgi:hypothetical protein